MAFRDKKLGEIGEEELVEIIIKYLDPPKPFEHLLPGDDARDFLPSGPKLVFSSDAYSFSSLKLPWRTWRDVGWAGVVGCISDHFSKGSVPYAAMISLGLSPEMRLADFIDLIEGVREALSAYNIAYAGGDLNSSRDPWISTSIIGSTTAKKPPRRSGARPGDKIVVTGIYGAMGIVSLDGINEALRHEWIIEATRRPRPQFETSIVVANYYRWIDASMDVSDGLSYTLYVMAREAGLSVRLASPPQHFDELKEYCRGRRDPERCVIERCLAGGEEYGVVMAINEKYVGEITEMLERYNVPHAIIGEFMKNGVPGEIFWRGEKIGIVRWDQFLGWTENYG